MRISVKIGVKFGQRKCSLEIVKFEGHYKILKYASKVCALKWMVNLLSTRNFLDLLVSQSSVSSHVNGMKLNTFWFLFYPTQIQMSKICCRILNTTSPL